MNAYENAGGGGGGGGARGAGGARGDGGGARGGGGGGGARGGGLEGLGGGGAVGELPTVDATSEMKSAALCDVIANVTAGRKMPSAIRFDGHQEIPTRISSDRLSGAPLWGLCGVVPVLHNLLF